MPNLRLGAIADDRPVRVTVQLSASVHRMLVAYAELHAKHTGQAVAIDKLIPAILERFMTTDPAFTREWRKLARHADSAGSRS
jgi:hypothetical protein